MNSLYEYGSNCDVIIRCNSERTIGGRTYSANEPYTILKNVFCRLAYRENVKEGAAKNNVQAIRFGVPDLINISNVALTDKICNLIATKVPKSRITKVYSAPSVGGKIYLPEEPISDSIFVFNGNDKMSFTVDGYKLVGDFKEDETYIIFYEVIASTECYDLNTPQYGYFSIEIIGVGNTEKVTNNIHMVFPAVSLISVPTFDFINGGIMSAPLQFECIHRGQKSPYFNIGG